MIVPVLEFVLRQRALVIGVTCLLAVAGVFAFKSIPIDAFPDVTNIQVQILTEASGLAPIEVERFITYPIELQMTGLPGLTEIRSLSKFALSQITVVFHDEMDLYFARQLVLERLIAVKDRLPPGVEPVLAPVATGLGEIYQYYLEGPNAGSTDPLVVEAELTEHRTLQDWVLRPLFKSVPGVIDVNSLGGFVKQYQVLVDPAALRKYDLALQDVYAAVAKNNANVGGNVLERHSERAIVRGVGLIKSVDDIERILLKEAGGTPVYVRDVAEVRIGHAVRHGAAVLNGEREVVAGIVLMLRGGNAREVVQAVKEKVEAIHLGNILPGHRIIPFYDRIELVHAAIRTVQNALIEGIVLVALVFFVFLGNVRSVLVVMTALLVTPLVTFIVMQRVGLSANLMTLGGLAIAIGEIADGSLVVVENVYRHLAQNHNPVRSKSDVILHATKEVGRPILFGILIITVVFLPLMTLHGIEGKMFAPLAYTLVIALLASVVVTLTLSPVLSSVVLRGHQTDDTRATRWMRVGYQPVLGWALKHRSLVLTGSLLLLGASLLMLPSIGREFIPTLDEGALTPQVVRLPSVSLPDSIAIEREVQEAMLEFPEVRLVLSKIGRSDIAYTPEEPNESDPIVLLAPRDQWTTAGTKAGLVDAIRRRLAEIPGIAVLMSQPIQERVDELISGIRTECAIKLFGDDLSVLQEKADEIAGIMRTVRGVKDVKVEPIAGQPYLTVDIDRWKIARYALNVADVQDIIATAVGGRAVTTIYEGERRFQLIVRLPERYRNSVAAIGDIRVMGGTGRAPIPLSDLATIDMQEGPARISREQIKRRIYIGFNVVDRDIGSVVDEGRRRLAADLQLPEGYSVTWGGTFESMERANARLLVVVPITLGLIVFLLFLAFHSWRYAVLIMLNLPFALIGGIVSLWLTDQYLSVPASIGFIELFGLAVGNGIVLVSYINQLRNEGKKTEEAIVAGCTLRLRPVVMTMMTTLLGLLPLALAQGIGADVQRPLATVVIGGVFTSTMLTLVVLPALYWWLAEKEAAKAHAAQWV